jgi:hypothetical protein
MWHQPLNPTDNPSDHLPAGMRHGYISTDGCLFNCRCALLFMCRCSRNTDSWHVQLLLENPFILHVVTSLKMLSNADVYNSGCQVPCTCALHPVACRHVAGGAVHTYLIIDRSSSMASRTITPDSPEIRSHQNIHYLNNVLGVVHEASMKYIRERSSRAPSDLLTYIPFNHEAVVYVQEQSMQDAPRLLDSLMGIVPGGGTMFSSALRTAHNHLKQVWLVVSYSWSARMPL